MSKKVSLVLEGGGMRGAYTAGCLSWLIDEGIEFDYAYGISTGAVHLTSFLMKNEHFLFEMATEIIAHPSLVGIRSLLREGNFVGYEYLFSHFLRDGLHFDIKDIIGKTKTLARYGVYDMEKGETIYVDLKDMNMDLLKAACSLPILGKPIVVNGHKYLDGGITKMIPIEEAVKDGCSDHLIITTKPYDYVRKPAKPFIVNLMKNKYKDCPEISVDYKNRHLNYNKQIELIENLEKDGHALYRYPTETVNVTRLKGDKKDLIALYELGRKDMEASREEIYKLIK